MPRKKTRSGSVTSLGPSTSSADLSSCAGKRYVLTGGCGFLGQHMARLLLELPDTQLVTIVDLQVTDVQESDSTSTLNLDCHNRINEVSPHNPRCLYRFGDITKIESLMPTFHEHPYDIIFHVAALVRGSSIHPWDRPKYVYVNSLGTQRVLESCLRCGIYKMVYTSSVTVVIPPNKPLVRVREEDCPYPETNIDYCNLL